MRLSKILKYGSFISWSSLTALLLTFASCESNVLDNDPDSKLSSEAAFETYERCDLSILGAYSAALQGEYNGEITRGYPFGSASIIQSEMRGEDMNLNAVFYDVTYGSTWSRTTANNVHVWTTSFAAISRYNTVYEGIEWAEGENILTAEQANQFKGELLFLRALTYHNLMIHFALPYNVDGNNNYGLPIYTKALTSEEAIEDALKIERSSVKDTYAQIIKDLDQAETWLADKNVTRASKGAAIALKTRVYLHMRDWNNVIAEAKKLTSSTSAPFASSIGGYILEANPASPFTGQADSKESIFQIENSVETNPGVNGGLPTMMSFRTGARSLITSSPTLYNSTYWLADDARRDLLMYDEKNDYYYCDKYQDPTTRSDNAPIIRYAEVLLNYAEAALRSGDSSLALELLNAVRNRALADPATQAYTASSFSTNAEFMNALIWERRIEFHGEGRRWEDIHRLVADDLVPTYGIPQKIEYSIAKADNPFVIGKAIDPKWYREDSENVIPYTEYKFLWPIPEDDMTYSPILAAQQNAGW